MTSADTSGVPPIDVRGAFIRRTDFSGASLRRADLSHADATGALFRDADFEGARLIGTILRGADLTGAKNVTEEQLADAVIDSETRLPSYIDWTRINAAARSNSPDRTGSR